MIKSYLKFLILIFIISGCTESKNLIREDQLYVTRKFCGTLLTVRPVESGHYRGTTQVITDESQFHIKGNPEVPVNARCYFQMKEERFGGESVLWMLYFTWDGTDDLYYIIQDPVNGKIF